VVKPGKKRGRLVLLTTTERRGKGKTKPDPFYLPDNNGAVREKRNLTPFICLDLDLYRKSKRGPKKPPRPKDQYKNGGHVSTYKELRDKDP